MLLNAWTVFSQIRLRSKPPGLLVGDWRNLPCTKLRNIWRESDTWYLSTLCSLNSALFVCKRDLKELTQRCLFFSFIFRSRKISIDWMSYMSLVRKEKARLVPFLMLVLFFGLCISKSIINVSNRASNRVEGLTVVWCKWDSLLYSYGKIRLNL